MAAVACCTKKIATLCLFSVAFLPLLCHAADTIKLGESLRDGETLISAQEIFELGFFSPGKSPNRYVGIWYRSSDSSVLWVANRQNPVKDSSGALTIDADGNLVVLDGSNTTLWSSNTSSPSDDSVAQLTDSGNLVLNKSGNLVWQSFDYPSDTYMPGMKVGLDLRTRVNQYITSWTSEDDPAPGNFSLSMDPSGSTQIFMWQGAKPRWRSGRWNGQVFIGIQNMISQYVYGFKLNNFGEEQKMYFYFEQTTGFHNRYVLTWDGIERHMTWKNDTGGWFQYWAQPLTDCEIYNQCGKNAGCTDEATPICRCLEGFLPASSDEWNNGNWTSGCVRRTALGCNGGGAGGDGFLQLQGVKLPDKSDWYGDVVDADGCRERCLMNCSCTAYAYVTGIRCLMWGLDLLDIHMFNSSGEDLFLRLAGSELENNKNWTLIIIIIVVVVVFCLCSLLLLWKFRKGIKGLVRQPKNEDTKVSVNSNTVGGSRSAIRFDPENNDEEFSELQLWSFDLVLTATKEFDESELIGQGGFGPVYKGVRPEGQEIAVKRLSRSSGQGIEEFKNEVKLISKLQHRNLVKLLGCCIHDQEKILIYEYMPNKSLDAFLYDPAKKALLNWSKRYNIIEGIARGLMYLHRDSRLRIIHRDLKASNILLDEEMNPKISDFGMARIFSRHDDESNTTRVVGTFGYMAPEYAMQGILSDRTDVYSFGVLVLEILSGKRNNTYHPVLGINLIALAWKMWDEKKVMEFVDPVMAKSCDKDEEKLLSRCMNVGLLCVQDQPSERPSMNKVVVMLESETTAAAAASLARPKQPTFTTNSYSLSETTDTSTIELKEVISRSWLFSFIKKRVKAMEMMLLLLAFILLKGPVLAHGQSEDKMNPSSSIVNGQTLVSMGKIFELGFFSPGDENKQFLGIWFKNISVKTVVWVANRDKPVEDTNGTLNLTADGNLVLFNSTGFVLWSTGTSNTINPVLQLLDTGNLVLTGGPSNSTIWQSFDHPTDTFLPGMKLGLDYRRNLEKYMTSWASPSDPSPGEYSYKIDTSGVPQFILWRGNTCIYRSGPWTGNSFTARPNMGKNNLFKFHYISNQYELSYSFEVLDPTVLAKVSFDMNGDFERLIWTKGSNAWNQYWKVPDGQCDQYAACGSNGICTTNYSPSCQCLQGFYPKSHDQWNLRQYSNGCVRRISLNCSTDGFLQLHNLKLPDTPNEISINMTLDQCMTRCLTNCSCTAYAVIEGSRCLTWSGDLLDIRTFDDGGDDVYIRLAASELEALGANSGKRKIDKIVFITVPVGTVVLICLFLLLWLKCKRKRQGKIKTSFYEINEEDELELPLFDILTIRTATNNFSDENVIGEGGFGPVYKGQLEDGPEIAVKRLSKDSVQGLHEFKTEVLLIAKLQHKNLVRLLGCCIEEEERILVYEYMQNKSLDAFIFDKFRCGLLDWKKRLDIITGIARGLLYLHHDSRLKIIHRDLKASNILLDKEMNPKISDFGTARIFKVDQIEENTKRVVGTYGYMSPEYAMEGFFSEKSDVFSFGVVVLEILSGKRSRTVSQSEPRKNLLQYAWTLWREDRCFELVDEGMGDSYPKSKVKRFIQVGLLCVQEGSNDRPTMENVVLMLSSEDVMLPEPSRVAFYKTSTLARDCTSSDELSVAKIEGR
ncbi:hypothetical protein Cni_G21759 [Canna indica]|uniref:non-specific serine/threonine protein kinase n=1 Tax=Canna indica TaxID=4628 RepID=A0AAQ3QM06_9LILI|nr:hypothetical protein Cni_G21759 [Canna indica]